MTKVFLNNRIIDSSQAVIGACDSGFLYGAGLFETMRSKNGIVFAIEDHLARLFASAAQLNIVLRGDKRFITDAVYDTITAGELSQARIRLTVSNGPVGGDESEPTMLITAQQYQPYPDEYYKKGIMVVLSNSRQSSLDVTAGHKTTSCFSRILTLAWAHEKGAAEALWFTLDGRLSEGCVSNIFLVKDSTVYTPPVDTPVLPGIARKYIIAAAANEKIELIEKELLIKDLLEADEVFLTNVIMGALPVIRIESHDVGDARPGAITKKIASLFNNAIEDYYVNFSKER